MLGRMWVEWIMENMTQLEVISSSVPQHSGVTVAHKNTLHSDRGTEREELVGSKHELDKCKCKRPDLITLDCIQLLKYCITIH